jgi:hypothetical protein
MVASSANTSRPRAPAACGDIARAFATKAAISSEADDLASGNAPALPDAAFCAEDTSAADFGLVGSPDISARRLQQVLMWVTFGERSMRANRADPSGGEGVIRPADRTGGQPWRQF